MRAPIPAGAALKAPGRRCRGVLCWAMDRISPTRRPSGPPQGYHQWRHLLFLHWPIPEEVLRPLVPPALSIDTFEGQAWVGLVLFTMQGIRPTRFLPAIPGVSAFHETNVRTYVHHKGKDPGVWFFSLDAANSLAVRAARWGWSLPYFRATMSVERSVEGEEDTVHYHSLREWPQPAPAMAQVRARLGDPLPPADPDSLTFFFAERYLLYAQKEDGTLLSGQVYHTPYPLREARVEELEEDLLAKAGLPRGEQRAPDLFSEGVDVEVFPLRPVEGRAGDGEPGAG